jgi:hypothetical protein
LQVGVIEIFGEIGSVYLPSLSTTTQTLKIWTCVCRKLAIPIPVLRMDRWSDVTRQLLEKSCEWM